MNSAIEHPPIAEERDLCLIRGGPFYRAQQAARLIHSDQGNHVGRLAFAIILGWLPLILLAAFSHPERLLSLLTDYRVPFANARCCTCPADG